jgi:cell division septal protein FtsQ
MLGREQGLATRERIERFVRVYPELVARIGQWPGTIDLRYPNGFAIRLADAQAATAVARPGSGGTSSSATR